MGKRTGERSEEKRGEDGERHGDDVLGWLGDQPLGPREDEKTNFGITSDQDTIPVRS
jgi:hypothetical protein